MGEIVSLGVLFAKRVVATLGRNQFRDMGTTVRSGSGKLLFTLECTAGVPSRIDNSIECLAAPGSSFVGGRTIE
jgi:hypothetical protein